MDNVKKYMNVHNSEIKETNKYWEWCKILKIALAFIGREKCLASVALL